MRGAGAAALLMLLAVADLAAQARPAEGGGATRFDLQNNFWVNLHHRLLQAAGGARIPVFEVLTTEENEAWLRAIAIYKNRYARRTLFLDPELITINDRLSLLGREDSLATLNDGTLRELLERAAPIYERYWWAADERANRFWIRIARAMLEDAGDELLQYHARVYGVTFPPVIRVDVTSWAGQNGAYTTDGPHVTISSRDAGYQGFAGLEMLLHEASHAVVAPDTGTIGGAIAREAEKLGVPPPPDLWHAILFYTSGELTRRALIPRGVSAYTPYAYRNGVYERGWTGYRTALEDSWQEYLDGKRTRDEAIAALVAALRPRSEPQN